MRFYLFSKRKVKRGIFIALIGALLCLGGYGFNSWIGAVPVLYGDPVYQGSNQEKEMALTINVFWGEEYLPQMLATFKEKNVPATFFIGGTWAKKFPELTKEIDAAGHEIGSHGYSHPHPDSLSKSANLKEMQKTEDLIYKITGQRPKLFAPPYGEHGPTVLQAAQEAGYKTILWTIDTIDWQRPQPQIITQRVTSKASNGAIVLMHPTAPTVNALPVIIDELKAKDYKFVTVSKLLEGLNEHPTQNNIQPAS